MMVTELTTEELTERWEDVGHGADCITIDAKDQAWFNSRVIAETLRDEDGCVDGVDWEGIRAWCRREQHWPDVWATNDHGNVSLHDVDGNYYGGLV